MKNNQNSATEDTLGFLHSAVTRAFLAKLGLQMDVFDAAKRRYDDLKFDYDSMILDEDLAGAEAAKIGMESAQLTMMSCLDEKTIAAAGKWVRDNEITYATPEDNGESELSQELKSIKDKQKGNIIQFDDAKEA